MDKDLKEEVCGVDRINDRIMSVKLTIGGDIITVLSVYAPQTGCSEEEKDTFWKILDGVTMEIPDNERVIIGGDLNGHVGGRRSGEDRIHGGWSYGERNAAGHKIAEYAVCFDLMIANTYFNRKREQLITYRSGDHKSQLDYLLYRRKHIKEIKNTKVIYSESVAAQHKLVVADYEMVVGKRRKCIKRGEQRIKWWKLKEEGLREEFKETVLREVKLPDDVQEWWSYNSNVITKAGKDVLGVTTGKGPPEDKEAWWWNEEVQKAIKVKKDAKKQWDLTGRQEDREAYKTAKKKAKRAVAKAKAEAVDGAYEELERRQDGRQLLRIAKAKDKATKDITSMRQIKDESGVVLHDLEKILNRWQENFERLLNEENVREKYEDGDMNEGMTQSISREEVEHAMKKMKNGKALGADQIPIEAWKSLGEQGTDILCDLMQKIWKGERMPHAWRNSILIPIYKGKGDIQNCNNYRGIKLMSHTMKIWERIIEKRLRLETEVCEEQFGFMPGRGTTDAIFALRQLMERHREVQAELHMAFIDLEKAYDRVPRQEIWRCLRSKGLPEKYIRVVEDMYDGAMTQVRSSAGTTKAFPVRVGLHQGSALSPYLFDLVMDVIVKDVKKEAPWCMMFADDVVICESTQEALQDNLEQWRKALEERGMRISRVKTDYMCTKDAKNSYYINLQGEQLTRVEKFKYLGSYVQCDGGLEAEIQHRINSGWMNWRKLSGVLCDRKVSCRMKGKLYKSVVRPAMLYSAETWPITKAQEKKLEVAEMRMLRWMSGVTRKDRIRNEYIRGTVKVGPIGKKIQESRLRWYGHVQRRGEYYVGRRVEDLEIEGSRRRGRPKLRWKDKITGDLREKGWHREEVLDRHLWKRRIQQSNADPT